MDSTIILAARGLGLVVLWLFVLMVLRLLHREVTPVALQKSSRRRNRRHGHARQLVAISGPLAGSTLDIASLSEVVIGRAADCQFNVGDDYASARHARLFRRGDVWFIEDLDSRNGTLLAGQRIETPEEVAVNTDIKIGATTLRVVD